MMGLTAEGYSRGLRKLAGTGRLNVERENDMPEGKRQLFAKLMDEELSKLEKEPDEPLSRSEFLDALHAVYDRAPTEIQEDIYALAKALVEALRAPAGTPAGHCK
jgi:hypothetical protein